MGITFFKNLDSMKYYRFNNISDVLEAIIAEKFDRNFIYILGTSYEADETTIGSYTFEFNERNLREYAFLFYFFNVTQVEYDSEYFRNIMEQIAPLDSSNLCPLEIKKIIYKEQLNEINAKYEKKLISEDVFRRLTNQYLA